LREQNEELLELAYKNTLYTCEKTMVT